LKDTVELVRHAEKAGADLISILPPSYGAESPEMVFEYFRLIAEETRLGLSVFNTPHAGYVMSPELLARVAELPNVVALKNVTTLDHTIAVRELVRDSLLVIDPQEENFLINLIHFEQPAIYTNTNYMYDSALARPMQDYVMAGLNGDAALAASKFYAMQDLRSLHHKWVRQGWHRFGQCPVATVKCWVEQLGMKGGSVRPPLPTLSEAEQQELVADLEAAGLSVS
jgi:4-hydroxy-tetrahydrodipicolinate synthase